MRIVLKYGLETVQLKNSIEKNMEVSEMKMIMLMIEVTKRERIREKTIKRTVNSPRMKK